jgi:hypothetical protein
MAVGVRVRGWMGSSKVSVRTAVFTFSLKFSSTLLVVLRVTDPAQLADGSDESSAMATTALVLASCTNCDGMRVQQSVQVIRLHSVGSSFSVLRSVRVITTSMVVPLTLEVEPVAYRHVTGESQTEQL